MKSIIYYTDNKIEEPIRSVVQKYIKDSGLPIVSVSLKPIPFGRNIVFSEQRCYLTYLRQIVIALTFSTEDYVFFCENDVLYPKSHFDFIPPREDVFYYNRNVWRWMYGGDMAVTYDRMLPLSCLCANRKLALGNYELRLRKAMEAGLDKFESREPALARRWGYEPGTKKRKRGGLTDDDFDTWSSDIPVIDIRHAGTFSPPKCTLDSFKHAPVNWRELPIVDVPGWNLKGLFNL